MEAVYLNLETPDPKAPFRPDLDGARNVIAALEDRQDVLIAELYKPQMKIEDYYAYLKATGDIPQK
jgi:hypothetical protein